MFDNLNKYSDKGSFEFKIDDSLRIVCNAPTNKSGVYIVSAQSDNTEEIIYIGSSGKKMVDGSIYIRKGKLGGIKDRIVNGKQFGDARKRSWKRRMVEEKIDHLEIKWWITHCEAFIDCPELIENKCQREYQKKFGSLPMWNNKFSKSQ